MKLKNILIYSLSLIILSQPITAKYNSLTTQQKKNQAPLPSNPHPDKLVKHMNEQELCESLAYAKAVGNKELVLKIFHFLMTVSIDQDALKAYKLDLADYHYSLKDFEKAATIYEEFFILYPGSPEVEYSQYKAILCWFFLSLAPEKDQSFTHKTIMLIDDFLRKAKQAKYIDEAKSIKKKCRQKLFEHEAHVFEHYIKQNKSTSAQKRLDYIKEQFTDIDNINNYSNYLEKMLKLSQDPKRPFLIPFNLKDALVQEKTLSAKKSKKTALFFLS